MKSLGGVACSAATLLGATTAWGGDACDTSCPPGASVENDGCGPGLDPNGGCTQNPPAFQFVPTDAAICGTVGGWEDSQGAPGRDSDWYVFVVRETSLLRLNIQQESAATGAPSPKFVVSLLNSSVCGAGQTLIHIVSGECPIESESVLVEPGEYLLGLAVDAFGAADPATTCPVNYVARIQIDIAYPSCTTATESCFNTHGSPGCGDGDCCASVCANAAFSYCCTVSWDAYCAAEASMNGACAGDGCPRARIKSTVAHYLVARSRGKMDSTSPDLLEVHLQMSTALSLSVAAKSQLPNPGSFAGCSGINVGAVAGKFDKVIALGAFADDQVQYLITNPGLTPDEVAFIVAVIKASLDDATILYELIEQQLSPCPTDLTGDGLIDGADLAVLLGRWGLPGLGDLDESGAVDGADLAALLGAWGACPGDALRS